MDVGTLGAPASDTVVCGGIAQSGIAQSGIAEPGAAIAYPYLIYPGSPGIAPDNTIVVTGMGQAQVRADGSDRASAERTASGAADADAKVQADAIAAASGLSISDVLSVRASVSPSYGIEPMAAQGSGTVCPARVPAATGAPGAPTVPEPACLPIAYQPSLSVSVTVEYRVG